MADGSIRVVAAVVRRGDDYLLGRRPAHKRHGGLWEFPGGKVRDGESTLEAARRELSEELSLDVDGIGATRFTRRDPGSPFVIDFVEVSTTGDPEAREHEEIGWFTVGELADLDLAPTDRVFADLLARDRPAG